MHDHPYGLPHLFFISHCDANSTGVMYPGPDPARIEPISSVACDGKHAVVSFDIQYLKPSVYDCVAGRIPVTERLNQHSLQVPVRQPCHRFYHCQDRKQRFGVLERCNHLVPVCARHILVFLRIVPDDQRLATLDVFLVVSHRQSVSDLLIFSFFGLEVDEDIHDNALGKIMQHATVIHSFKFIF